MDKSHSLASSPSKSLESLQGETTPALAFGAYCIIASDTPYQNKDHDLCHDPDGGVLITSGFDLTMSSANLSTRYKS